MGSSIKKISYKIEKLFYDTSKDNFVIHPLGWSSIKINWFFKTPKIILVVILSKLLMKIGGIYNPPNKQKLNNLIDYILRHKDNIHSMSAKTFAGCKIRYWQDNIIILRQVRTELPCRLITNWNTIVFDNRWIISGDRNIRINYPSKKYALILRKKFDRKKELPWEIWTAIPLVSDRFLLKTSLVNLDESNLNNHLFRYNDFFNYVCYVNKIKIKFLF